MTKPVLTRDRSRRIVLLALLGGIGLAALTASAAPTRELVVFEAASLKDGRQSVSARAS